MHTYLEVVLSYGEHNLDHVLDARRDLAGVKDRPQCLKDSMDTTRAHLNQLQTNLLETQIRTYNVAIQRLIWGGGGGEEG